MIAILGCGAVGSPVALSIAMPDRSIGLVDDDRVGRENILTSAFYDHQEGALKARVLAEMLWRKCGCRAMAYTRTFGARRASGLPLHQVTLLVDLFDNTEARRAAMSVAEANALPIIHAGVGESGVVTVAWGNSWPLPVQGQGVPRGANPVCTHQVNRRFLWTCAFFTAHAIETYLASGVKWAAVVAPGVRIMG